MRELTVWILEDKHSKEKKEQIQKDRGKMMSDLSLEQQGNCDLSRGRESGSVKWESETLWMVLVAFQRFNFYSGGDDTPEVYGAESDPI